MASSTMQYKNVIITQNIVGKSNKYSATSSSIVICQPSVVYKKKD